MHNINISKFQKALFKINKTSNDQIDINTLKLAIKDLVPKDCLNEGQAFHKIIMALPIYNSFGLDKMAYRIHASTFGP